MSTQKYLYQKPGEKLYQISGTPQHATVLLGMAALELEKVIKKLPLKERKKLLEKFNDLQAGIQEAVGLLVDMDCKLRRLAVAGRMAA